MLCMLVQDSLVDQPQAEGTFPVQIKLIRFYYLSHLSVIQKNFYKFDRPRGREAARLFSLQLFLFTNTISAACEELFDHPGAIGFFFQVKLFLFIEIPQIAIY